MSKKKQKTKNSRILKAPSPIEILLLGVIVICCFLLLTQDFNLFLKIFYSKFSFLILFLLILEFLIIKSSDRSKVYRNELERLREIQEENLMIVRDVENRLDDALKVLSDGENKEELERPLLEEVHGRIEDVVAQLKKRK